MPVKTARHLLFLAQGDRATLDNLGYHIRPVHYYEPLPDFRAITKDRLERKRNYAGMEFNWPAQLELVRELANHADEFEKSLTQARFDRDNGYFSGLDAAVYYALIRNLQPAHVVEVGGGYSTHVAEAALLQNRTEGHGGKLTCIEPYPGPQLMDEAVGCELIAKPVQDVAVDFFSKLEANDILFIDSSHTVKFGSDVCYLFLEVLPSLKPGVWIHVHDIFFPNDYPPEWLIEQRLALNEQYIVEAFLSFNRSFSIRLANHWLCLDYPETVTNLGPTGAANNHPSSLWFQRVEWL